MLSLQMEHIGLLVCVGQEPPNRESGWSIDDFVLGEFDEVRLGENPPQEDGQDWFPPPSLLTEWELSSLVDWVEVEAEKHDLVPDPDTYPLDDYFFTKGELKPCQAK